MKKSQQSIFEKIGGLDGTWILGPQNSPVAVARFRLNFALLRGGGCAFGTAQEALPSCEQNNSRLGYQSEVHLIKNKQII